MADAPKDMAEGMALQLAPPGMADAEWAEVLAQVEEAWRQLAAQQEALQARNEELERMRAFLSSVLDYMSDALIVGDAEARLLEGNRALARLMGKAPPAGMPIVELFVPQARAALEKALRKVAASGAAQRLEAALRQAEGGGQGEPLDLVISPRRDSRGRYLGPILIGRPVGELRRAYDALREAKDRLVQQEKMASMGRLLAGVAHELNNPISFIYGSAHAMRRHVERLERFCEALCAAEPDVARIKALREELQVERALARLRTALEGATEGAERVRDIVDSLSRLSATGHGEKRAFELRPVAETAVRWVVKAGNRATPVKIHGNARAMGRPEQIQQVLMNLVENALDAVEGRSDGRVEVRIAQAGGQVEVEVCDNGPGIAPEHMPYIFDPFFTTKPVGRGTGLGLSISHKIAEEHGGSLSAVNRRQGGACFRLLLPAAEEDEA